MSGPQAAFNLGLCVAAWALLIGIAALVIR